MNLILNKQETKLFKLNSKAQECLSRVKAQKILHKHHKVRKKMTKMSEAQYRRTPGRKFPPRPQLKCNKDVKSQQGRSDSAKYNDISKSYVRL